MKKIILLLLISGGLTAQVVVPKSTTTFSNVSATGTLKVASTSTLVGKVRIGANTAPSATLDVTGTMSVSGTSTLTGAAKQTNTLNYEGNTTWNTPNTVSLTTGVTNGTVAVLSDAVFSLHFQADASNPADATTYYMGNTGYQLSATNNGTVTIPYNCTLVKWSYNYVNAGVNASAETGTLQVAGTTTANLTSAQSFSTVYGGGTGTVSVNFNAEDAINVKVIYPTFATNPTSVWSGMTLWFVRCQ